MVTLGINTLASQCIDPIIQDTGFMKTKHWAHNIGNMYNVHKLLIS